MTGTDLRMTQVTSEWAKIFTDNVTDNYTNSMLFMKQLTCIAASTILYMKNAFSEENYHTETFANLKLRLLKKTCSDERAQFVSSSLLAALSAVEKKYLESIALCFYEGEDTAANLLEYHIFKYHYKSGEATMIITSKNKNTERHTSCTLQDVQMKTLKLIRACMVFMSGSNLFTENTNIAIRIYFTSDTPDDYEVPGFTFVDEEIDPLTQTMSESIKLACVETPYHSLTARGSRNWTFKDSNEAYASQNVPVLTNDTDFSGKCS
ncbi:HORMA domain-containing protein 2-like [Pieris rapae]|uniref:HORMA domain-containing protein 2-like n=1 Tax=Pieris rapae TaxID=64459 RepID=UPI001E27FD53|nr:HORMA domain-containing protein 2-like [Pieris rapae]